MTRVLQLNPDDPRALADRSIARQALGKPAEALADAVAACRGGYRLACELERDMTR
jgi:regulator of sirC expression with transglutaminase-like and TPR domain